MKSVFFLLYTLSVSIYKEKKKFVPNYISKRATLSFSIFTFIYSREIKRKMYLVYSLFFFP
jgi:poly(3-hydroxyalkanoate) synthetase